MPSQKLPCRRRRIYPYPAVVHELDIVNPTAVPSASLSVLQHLKRCPNCSFQLLLL